MKVMLKASVNDQSLWGEPTGPAARAYGIAVCLNIREPGWPKYTPVKFK